MKVLSYLKLIVITGSLAFIMSAGTALATGPIEPVSGQCPSLTTGTTTFSSATGVLTRCTQPNFTLYIEAILSDDMGYIVLAALIMIVYSGVQYMLSGVGAPNLQKEAKERILTILMGVALLLLVDLIIKEIGFGGV